MSIGSQLLHVNSVINEHSPQAKSLLVLDAALVHVATEFRSAMYAKCKWAKFAHVNPGMTIVSVNTVNHLIAC
eukprot:4772839-Amphidinium_carterae.1